jgi:hypothetical protein
MHRIVWGQTERDKDKKTKERETVPVVDENAQHPLVRKQLLCSLTHILSWIELFRNNNDEM